MPAPRNTNWWALGALLFGAALGLYSCDSRDLNPHPLPPDGLGDIAADAGVGSGSSSGGSFNAGSSSGGVPTVGQDSGAIPSNDAAAEEVADAAIEDAGSLPDGAASPPDGAADGASSLPDAMVDGATSPPDGGAGPDGGDAAAEVTCRDAEPGDACRDPAGD
jgi:hypothetical protein